MNTPVESEGAIRSPKPQCRAQLISPIKSRAANARTSAVEKNGFFCRLLNYRADVASKKIPKPDNIVCG